MNERGFVTIFALCMILVVALVVKGIQQSDTSHNLEAADLQTEFDLQNAADGGIYEAAELVRSGKKDLPANNNGTSQKRKDNQRQLLTRTTTTARGKITVTVWGERLKIQSYTPNYSSESTRGYPVTAKGTVKYGYALLSVAQLDSNRMNGKIYRRAFAYVVDGHGKNALGKIVDAEVAPEDKDVVHFMELTSVKYRKK